MVSVMKPANSSVPNRIHTAVTCASRASGQSKRPSFRVSGTAASAHSGATMRGHQSLTPKTVQPSWISQNSSGGLWL